jgi:CubicO group peptidase (beta-lactamase class C family)
LQSIFNDYIPWFNDVVNTSIREIDYMSQGKNEALEMELRSDFGNIAGLVVERDGLVVYENYFNGYAAENAGHVYSVTKSVVSALIGIAIGEGRIGGVDRKVLDSFPEYVPMPGERTIQRITLKHLLTMTAPYKYEAEPYESFFESRDPIKDALDLLGGEGRIGEFNYSAIGGTHILSGILARAIGQPILDYAAKRLFSPLGIAVPRNVTLRDREEHIAAMNDKNTSGWVVDPQGLNWASWGLFLRPRDMAKIGQLYLNRGAWDGEQLVPAAWIEESTREQSRCAQWGDLAYGYLWWIVDEDSFAALGDGGNVIYVNSKERLVVAIASLFLPEAKDRIELIKKRIEPLFQG